MCKKTILCIKESDLELKKTLDKTTNLKSRKTFKEFTIAIKSDKFKHHKG